LSVSKETTMSRPQEEGRLQQDGKDDVGGDKKQRADRNEDSRTGGQNSGGGGRD
jgi:hypothetical protein